MNEHRNYLRIHLCVLAIAAFFSVISFAAKTDTLDFQGQVVLPPHTLPRRAVLAVTLQGVDVVYSGRTLADFQGNFAFHKLKPGSYFLILNFPRDGQIAQSIDITKSFADAKGRLKKRIEYTEESLRELMSGTPATMVSARELAIPYKAKALYRKAQDRLREEDVSVAMEHLEQAIEIAPKFLEAINFLGTIYFQQGEYSKSEEYFRRALTIDSDSFEPLVNLGGALLAQHRMLEAMAVNLHAKDLRPLDPLANAQLGLSYFSTNDFDHAIECLQRTIKIDPAHFSYPQLTLAEIYLRRSDRAGALEELNSFLSLHPDSPRAEEAKRIVARIQTRKDLKGESKTTPQFNHDPL